MILIRTLPAAPAPALPLVSLTVDRRTLAKRLWRGMAGDGREFGFELEQALRPGDCFYITDQYCYVIVQEPEPVLEVDLRELPPGAVAGLAWSVGNLHLECSADATHLRTPDDPAARKLLGRIQIPYTTAGAVFRAGHFRRSPVSAQELGSSHVH